MSEARIIAKAMKDGKPVQDLVILPALANRHGLITGATGTGKTVTLQKRAGVKRLVKPTEWLEAYMGRGISSTLRRFAGLRRCGLGAT